MGKKKLTLDYPLVDENLNVLEVASTFINQTLNELDTYEVTILVKDLKMAPTAMFFSMKNRRNMEFIVKLTRFKGSNFVHSFLKSGFIKEIVYE